MTGPRQSDSDRTTTLPAQVAELAALLADTQARLHLCEQSRQEWIADCRRLAELLQAQDLLAHVDPTLVDSVVIVGIGERDALRDRFPGVPYLGIYPETIILDDVVPDNFTAPLLWLDCEGSEVQALLGAKRVLSRVPYVIAEHRPASIELWRLLSLCGFQSIADAVWMRMWDASTILHG